MSKEASYTPGPWVAEPGGGKGAWIKGPTGEWAALACGDTDGSAAANARMIAAAPEMFEALEQHEAFLERLIAMVSGGSDMSPASIATSMTALLDMSSAALRKAKGEA